MDHLLGRWLKSGRYSLGDSASREKSERQRRAKCPWRALVEQTRQKKWGDNGSMPAHPATERGRCRHGRDHPRAPVVQVHSCPQDSPRYTPAGVEGFMHPRTTLTVRPVAHNPTEEDTEGACEMDKRTCVSWHAAVPRSWIDVTAMQPHSRRARVCLLRGDLAPHIHAWHGSAPVLPLSPQSADNALPHSCRRSCCTQQGGAAGSAAIGCASSSAADLSYMRARSGSCATAVGSDGAPSEPGAPTDRTPRRPGAGARPRPSLHATSVQQMSIRYPTTSNVISRHSCVDITLESGVEHTIHARNHGVALRGARPEVA